MSVQEDILAKSIVKFSDHYDGSYDRLIFRRSAPDKFNVYINDYGSNQWMTRIHIDLLSNRSAILHLNNIAKKTPKGKKPNLKKFKSTYDSYDSIQQRSKREVRDLWEDFSEL
jgi:hypothetical protein